MTISIEKVGVIGAGQMGSGIALVCAQAGMQVLLEDVADERIKAALATINGLLSRQIARGQIDEAERSAILDRIRVARGRDEVEAVGSGEGGGVRGGVVPFEGDRHRSGNWGGATAGSLHAMAGGSQLRDDAAAGRPGGADDENSAHGGHRLIRVKSVPGSRTARGFQ